MKALSAKTLGILALVSLVLTVLFTYLWGKPHRHGLNDLVRLRVLHRRSFRILREYCG